MKKLLLALGVIVLIVVVAMATNEANSPENSPNENETAQVSETDTMDSNMDGETSEMVDDEPLEAGEERYIVHSGSASYIVNKQWLEKDHEEVTGTTQDVSGTAIYNTESASITELMATVDAQSFDSGSGARDKDVQKRLGSKITARLIEPIEEVDADFSESVKMEVTINDATNVLTFEVTGQLQENGELILNGTSALSLEEFGIEAPSALGVYGVADDVDLKFDVVAKKQ